MEWEWGQARLLEELRERIASGAAPSDILAMLDEDSWTLPDAAKALCALFGLDRDTADHLLARHPAYAAVAARTSALRARLREAPGEAERVRILLRAADDSPGPRGASDAAIDALGARLHIAVPGELRAWLRLTNGSLAGYGGFFGVRPDPPLADIEEQARRLPQRVARAWLPIASDGCGSLYVLALDDVTRSGPAVLFLDWEDRRGELFGVASYAAASGIWPFVRLQLMGDLDLLDWHWPFDKDSTLREDPALAQCRTAPLPWDT